MKKPERLFERNFRHLRERNEYKRQRDELLAVLFQPYETRKHLSECLLPPLVKSDTSEQRPKQA